MGTVAIEAEDTRTRTASRTALQQMAVLVAYAVCHALLRHVSVSHWNLMSGLRVLCLLLVPTRFWPGLFLGEATALAFEGWPYHQRFGMVWMGMFMVPPLLLMAPAFACYRGRSTLLRGQQVDVAALLSCVLAGAIVNTMANTATLAVMRTLPGETAPAITGRIMLNYFLGGYLGALTLVPFVLVLIQRWRQPAASGALARDALGVALPPLLLLVWLASATHGADAVQVARMAMFVPVAWMTMRHGWQGAAVAGMLASLAVQVTMPSVRDPAVIQAQALIAFAISSLLMLGGRLSSPARPAAGQPKEGDRLRGFQLAQQGLYQEEQRLRHVAESLDRLGLSMRDGHKRMMDRLRPVLPANVEQAYLRHLDLTQREVHRLANALHPRAWREHGLKATFQEGPLAQAAALVGSGYACELAGSGLDHLAPDVHMMLYRQACEVMVYLLACEPARRIQVRIRGGSSRGRRWVVLRMTAVRTTPALRGRPVPEWRQLVALLGTNGQGLATVRERASIYGGQVHECRDEHHLRVTLLLHDALRLESEVPPSRSVPAWHA